MRTAFCLALTALVTAGSAASVETSTRDAKRPPRGKHTLAKDVQPIFDGLCVRCHLTVAPGGGLVLDAATSFRALVSAKSLESALLLVKPGAPEQSYLLHKLKGTHTEVGGSGQRMPLGGTAVDVSVIETITAWIRDGAPAK